jgi:hypothetical protein
VAQNFVIRNYRSDDVQQIVELLRTSFNEWPHFDLDCSPKDHWEWKYQDNPLKTNIVIVAETDNKIVGCDHKLFNKFKIAGKILTCRQGLDSATHPNYRGKSIYSKIREFEVKMDQKPTIPTGIQYYASSNPIIINKEEELGEKHFPYPILALIRIIDIDLHLKKRKLIDKTLIKYGYDAMKILNTLENSSNKKKKQNSNMKIVEIKKFDNRTNNFWNKIQNNYAFIAVRSKEYLNWRYCDHRGGNYIVKAATENDDIIGYVVLRINNFDKTYPIGYVVDLCTLLDRPDCAELLIEESLRYFDERKINVINYCTVKGHPYSKLFKKFGFLDSRMNKFIGYFPTNPEANKKEFVNAKPDKLLFQYNDIDYI